MDGGEGGKKWRGDIIPGEKENLAATLSPMGILIPGQPSPRSGKFSTQHTMPCTYQGDIVHVKSDETAAEIHFDL